MPTQTKRKHIGGVTPLEGVLGNARVARKYALKAMEYADGERPEDHLILAGVVAELDQILSRSDGRRS